MIHPILTMEARWDASERIFYSESNIQGLHIEAPTLKEFESIFEDVISDLIKANYSPQGYRYIEPTRVWEASTSIGIVIFPS